MTVRNWLAVALVAAFIAAVFTVGPEAAGLIRDAAEGLVGLAE